MRRSLSLVTLCGAASIALTPMLRGQATAQVPASEYTVRRARVITKLPNGILLVPPKFDVKAEDQHGFHQNPDFYYLSGLGNALRAVLLIDGPRPQSLLFVTPL
ncbi:MAG: aminopeptidase P N-terminal domain-containing protein [Gemmatimonadales bacterium]|nr:aminopeptidase P N-terminal domain-containing protein [Gemmatimonadales bacterium]